jgi:serine/threonine protein kinase
MILSDDGRLYLVDFGSVKIQNKHLHTEYLSRKSNSSIKKEMKNNGENDNHEYLFGPSSFKNSLSDNAGNTWVGTEAYQSPEVKNSEEPG